MIIDHHVLVQFKSVEYLLPVHIKHVLTYLNFRTEHMRTGVFFP